MGKHKVSGCSRYCADQYSSVKNEMVPQLEQTYLTKFPKYKASLLYHERVQNKNNINKKVQRQPKKNTQSIDVYSVVPQSVISESVYKELIRRWKNLDVETQTQWMKQVK